MQDTAQTSQLWSSVRRWFRSDHVDESVADDRVDWVRCVPFILLHVACLAAFWVGVSPIAVAVAIFLYLVRMFAITAFFHRYFSHRTFRTSRFAQFLFAVLGSSAVQRGPLWWAAHHRHHHRESDLEPDLHSPRQRGFLWSHMLWFLTPEGFRTDRKLVKDLSRYPELVWLDRYDLVAPVALAALTYGAGVACSWLWPQLGTSGPQMFVWGFLISTVVLYHATYTINSLAHLWGHRRFPTKDDSRNNWFLAILTLGEGWHNNHHHYAHSARQGFYWWQIDPTYWGLVVMERLGIIRDLKPVPEHVKQEGLSQP
ncbi:MAG: acyl-CoA desaturase [Planctomycetota bacterium]